LLFLVITKRAPQFDPSLGPAHRAYFDPFKRSGEIRLTGPFLEESGGGAYVLDVANRDAAVRIASGDPLVSSGSSTIDLYAWNATFLPGQDERD
jgi:uncharacterized protein YciI